MSVLGVCWSVAMMRCWSFANRLPKEWFPGEADPLYRAARISYRRSLSTSCRWRFSDGGFLACWGHRDGIRRASRDGRPSIRQPAGRCHLGQQLLADAKPLCLPSAAIWLWYSSHTRSCRNTERADNVGLLEGRGISARATGSKCTRAPRDRAVSAIRRQAPAYRCRCASVSEWRLLAGW